MIYFLYHLELEIFAQKLKYIGIVLSVLSSANFSYFKVKEYITHSFYFFFIRMSQGELHAKRLSLVPRLLETSAH